MPVSDLAGIVHISDTPQQAAASAAQHIQALSAASHEKFSIALSGGSTPRLLYGDLASPPLRDSISWQRWQVFFGDERAVPIGSPLRNDHMASETLLQSVPIPAGNVHSMPAEESDLKAAAYAYAQTLQRELGPHPRFDCILLGMGPDGHTASLFPGTAALDESELICTPGLAPVEPHHRLTLTFPIINAARTVLFLVCGADKKDALRKTVQGEVPASRVQPQGDLHWYLDAAAAG